MKVRTPSKSASILRTHGLCAELFPWSSLEAAVKRKPKALQEKEKETRAPTMLDQFVSKPARDDGGDTDEEDVPSGMNIVTNEDGTLSMGSAESEPS